MKICMQCGREMISKYNKFCNSSCAAIYNNKRRDKDKIYHTKKTKIIKCAKCEKEIEVNIRAPMAKCSNCKKEKIICNICGNEKRECKRRDICRRYKLFPALIKYFGFNSKVIGTEQVYEEFERIKNILIEEYWINNLSLSKLIIKYNSPDIGILKTFNIPRRSRSDAEKNKIVYGNIKKLPCCKKYKHGYHTTWNSKEVFYRSSYELEYAKELDDKKIDYEMENLRIVYYDSKLNTQRIAIPDFYLKDSNTIVEIKSNYTYDEQNMKDKVKAYKIHGYNVRLFLDKKEIQLPI